MLYVAGLQGGGHQEVPSDLEVDLTEELGRRREMEIALPSFYPEAE